MYTVQCTLYINFQKLTIWPFIPTCGENLNKTVKNLNLNFSALDDKEAQKKKDKEKDKVDKGLTSSREELDSDEDSDEAFDDDYFFLPPPVLPPIDPLINLLIGK